MRYFIVGAEQVMNEAATESRCVECKCHFKEGDVVVTFDQGPKVYVHRQLFIHRRHFDQILAEAPTEERVVDEAIAAIVSRARETGQTPVEEILCA